MADSQDAQKIVARGKRWKLIAAGVALVAGAVVPPIAGLFSKGTTITISGGASGPIAGRDVTDNRSWVTNYVTVWKAGAYAIAGKEVSAESLIENAPSGAGQPAAEALDGKPRPGDLGRLVTNTSLLNGSTWTLSPSPIGRLVSFDVRAVAEVDGDKAGRLDAVLSRDGKEVCSLSLTSATSHRKDALRYENTACQDVVPAGVSYTYQAKVKATQVNPMTLAMNVDGHRR